MYLTVCQYVVEDKGPFHVASTFHQSIGRGDRFCLLIGAEIAVNLSV